MDKVECEQQKGKGNTTLNLSCSNKCHAATGQRHIVLTYRWCFTLALPMHQQADAAAATAAIAAAHQQCRYPAPRV
jgi:hypothetical protein